MRAILIITLVVAVSAAVFAAVTGYTALWIGAPYPEFGERRLWTVYANGHLGYAISLCLLWDKLFGRTP
jgi:hypothetical protein